MTDPTDDKTLDEVASSDESSGFSITEEIVDRLSMLFVLSSVVFLVYGGWKVKISIFLYQTFVPDSIYNGVRMASWQDLILPDVYWALVSIAGAVLSGSAVYFLMRLTVLNVSSDLSRVGVEATLNELAELETRIENLERQCPEPNSDPP